MNKIKDIIYEYNDVVVALLIVALTAGIVCWRINVIMGYSDKLANAGKPGSSTNVDLSGIDLNPGTIDENLNSDPNQMEANWSTESAISSGSSIETGSAIGDPLQGQTGESQNTQQPQQNDGKFVTSSEVKYTVKSGASCKAIANDLADKGLIENADAFMEAVERLDKSRNIVAMTFTIPKGSTVDDIVLILSRSKKD